MPKQFFLLEMETDHQDEHGYSVRNIRATVYFLRFQFSVRFGVETIR